MSSDRLVSGKPYPLGDPLTLAECRQLGVRSPGGTITQGAHWSTVMAVWTGEKRPPKAGEWYLSGAKIEAYRAPNDFTSEYHIARLVTRWSKRRTFGLSADE